MHGEVSRRIFQPLFPRWPTAAVPISHITNGIHTPSWDCAESDALWTECCGKDRWLGTLEGLADRVRSLFDAAIWTFRATAHRSLIDFIRARLSTQRAASGMSAEAVESARSIFDEGALTLGFARRFATYKRPNLLLQDPERLIRLLSNPKHPVQLVMAGKAHPADLAGQALIQQWSDFIRRPDAQSRVIFVSDYDMLLTERLVQGADVWINTPQRPWEACGTSGMKILVNGGLNLSELDGWWAEAYRPEIGWALGDGQNHDGDPAWDTRDASQLFDLLEGQVVPEFYSRDDTQVPRAWIARVRESMASLTATYSANRSVRAYVDGYYVPAASAFVARAQDDSAIGRGIVHWKQALTQGWPGLRFGRIGVTRTDATYEFTAEVALGSLDSHAIRVELYADAQPDSPEHCVEMTRAGGPADCEGRSLYVGPAPLHWPPALTLFTRRESYPHMPALACHWNAHRYSGNPEGTCAPSPEAPSLQRA